MYETKAYKEFGQWLEDQRKRSNLSRSQMAKKIGYSNLGKGSRRIHDWENGKDFPSKKYSQKIIRALKIPIEQWTAQIEKIHGGTQRDESFEELKTRILQQTKQDLILNIPLLMDKVEEISKVPNWSHIHLPGLEFGLMYICGATTVQLGALLTTWKEGKLYKTTDDGDFYLLSGGGSPLSGMHKFIGFYRGKTTIQTHRSLLTGLGPFLGPVIQEFKTHNQLSSQWSLPQLLSQFGVYISDATIYHEEVEIGTYNFSKSTLYWKNEEIQFPLQKEDAYYFNEQNRTITEEWGPPTENGKLIIGNILTGQAGAWQGEKWEIQFDAQKWVIRPGALCNPQGFPEISWDMDIPPLVQEWIAKKHIIRN